MTCAIGVPLLCKDRLLRDYAESIVLWPSPGDVDMRAARAGASMDHCPARNTWAA